MLGAFVLFAGVPDAHAGIKRRAVPDLRRDVEAWTERGPVAHTIEIPLTIHVATREGLPVVSRTTARRWIRRANRELALAGIEVSVRSVRFLPEGWESVTRWRQRRQMAHYAPRDGTIHVFVIQELDTPKRRRLRRQIRGLYWRYRGLQADMRGREYVVVTRGAPTTTLAHELGHLFGLGHSTGTSNVMCSCRRGENIRFEIDQATRMRGGAKRYLARQYGSGVVRADRRRRARFRRRKFFDR